GEIRARPLPARAATGSFALRLLSFWRWTAHLYRQHLCHDGNDVGCSDLAAAFASRAGRRTGGGSAGGSDVLAPQGRGEASLDAAFFESAGPLRGLKGEPVRERHPRALLRPLVRQNQKRTHQ